MGDFTQEGNAYSFATSGNHQVILSGSEIQTVHFQNPQTSYFSNIDTTYSAGINCTYNVNYNVISLISSLSGSSFILDIIDTLDALGIDNIISLLNIATNLFVNENGIQYITREDIGKFVLGICDVIDDNVLLGLGQKISALFDKASPYDDIYYMYGKVLGDEIFLATFLYIGGTAATDAATAFGIAAGSAGFGFALSETGIGLVVCEGVAAASFVNALAATAVSAVCAAGVVHSDEVLKEDSQKLEDLKKESSKATEEAAEATWKKVSKELTEKATDVSSWCKGSFDSAQDSLAYHFEKHASEVGATSVEQYMRKAEGFMLNLRGAKKYGVDGAVEGTTRYVKNGKYIDLAPDGTIVSFGKR